VDSNLQLSHWRMKNQYSPWLLLIPYLPGQHVLIIGCESLSLASGLVDRGADVSVISFEKQFSLDLEQSSDNRLLNSINIVDHGSFPRITTADNYFDICVVFCDVAAADSLILYDEIYRVLNQRGSVVFLLDNVFRFEVVSGFLKRGLDFFRFFVRNYQQFGCRDRLKKMVKCGFIYSNYYPVVSDGSVDVIEDKLLISPSIPHDINVSCLKNNIRKTVKNSRLFKKYFSSSYYVYAYKKNVERNLLDKILLDISESWGFALQRCSSNIIVTRKGTAVFFTEKILDKKRYVVKIALGSEAEIQLKANYDALLNIHGNKKLDRRVKQVIPKPVFKSQCFCYHTFVEESLSGKSAVIYSQNKKEFDTIADVSSAVIQSLHVSSACNYPGDTHNRKKHILTRIKKMSAIVPTVEDARLEKLKLFLFENLVDANIPMVFHKGDCSANNILVDIDKSTFVCKFIDWDQSNSSYFPLVDIVNLLESFRRHKEKLPMGDVLCDFFSENFTETETFILKRYCGAISLSRNYIFPLLIMYWLDHIYAQNISILKNDSKWIKNNILNVFECVENYIV